MIAAMCVHIMYRRMRQIGGANVHYDKGVKITPSLQSKVFSVVSTYDVPHGLVSCAAAYFTSPLAFAASLFQL